MNRNTYKKANMGGQSLHAGIIAIHGGLPLT